MFNLDPQTVEILHKSGFVERDEVVYINLRTASRIATLAAGCISVMRIDTLGKKVQRYENDRC